MALTKQLITDRVESVKINDHYVLQVREVIQVLEDNNLLSQSFHRYVLTPDSETKTDKEENSELSRVTDPVVLAQFNAVMTSEVKANYQAFLASQVTPDE